MRCRAGVFREVINLLSKRKLHNKVLEGAIPFNLNIDAYFPLHFIQQADKGT